MSEKETRRRKGGAIWGQMTANGVGKYSNSIPYPIHVAARLSVLNGEDIHRRSNRDQSGAHCSKSGFGKYLHPMMSRDYERFSAYCTFYNGG
jgi:hypothetical protein